MLHCILIFYMLKRFLNEELKLMKEKRERDVPGTGGLQCVAILKDPAAAMIKTVISC